jgi:hypothetical protein
MPRASPEQRVGTTLPICGNIIPLALFGADFRGFVLIPDKRPGEAMYSVT